MNSDEDGQSAEKLEINLFGNVEVWRNAKRVTELSLLRMTWLLAVLVMAKGRAVLKKTLCEQLYGDPKARGELRTAKSQLNKLLPGHIINDSVSALRFVEGTASVTVDALVFEEAYNSRNFDVAADTYTGQFLNNLEDDGVVIPSEGKTSIRKHCGTREYFESRYCDATIRSVQAAIASRDQTRLEDADRRS